MIRCVRMLLVCLAAGLALVSPVRAQSLFSTSEPDITTHVGEGWIGTERVGINLTVRDHVEVIAGHFYYQRNPIDIPLVYGGDGRQVVLTDPHGGVFILHFTTNPESSGIDFYTSTGLAGFWTSDGRTYPVTFGFKTIYGGFGPEHWYEGVTDEPDAVFEARARRFLEGVAIDDREMVADSVSYPLGVSFDPARTVHDRAQLLAEWDSIFTPDFKAKLREAIPHEMFVHIDRETMTATAMAAGGDVWFDRNGAVEVRP